MRENSDLNRFAAAIASILVGGGLVGIVMYFFDLDLLLAMFIWVLLPFMLLGMALGLISWGTITAVFSGALKRRIIHYYEEMKKEEEAKAAAKA